MDSTDLWAEGSLQRQSMKKISYKKSIKTNLHVLIKKITRDKLLGHFKMVKTPQQLALPLIHLRVFYLRYSMCFFLFLCFELFLSHIHGKERSKKNGKREFTGFFLKRILWGIRLFYHSRGQLFDGRIPSMEVVITLFGSSEGSWKNLSNNVTCDQSLTS